MTTDHGRDQHAGGRSIVYVSQFIQCVTMFSALTFIMAGGLGLGEDGSYIVTTESAEQWPMFGPALAAGFVASLALASWVAVVVRLRAVRARA